MDVSVKPRREAFAPGSFAHAADRVEFFSGEKLLTKQTHHLASCDRLFILTLSRR
jgi:hypothetical protein